MMAAKIVKSMNHNYPFGALFAESTNGTVQKYKYNGKELDTTNNLNLYDYGVRSYDSVLRLIDPDGRETRKTKNYISKNSGSFYADIDYYNGLGYMEQNVKVASSPQSHHDVITPVYYDNMLRSDNRNYLPYVTTRANGANDESALASQSTYYASLYNEGTYAYAEKAYEASPLNRPTRVYQVGQAFRSASKYMEISYDTNTSGEVISFSVATDGSLVKNGYYGASVLHKVTITDEDGRQNIEYTDKAGRNILKRSGTTTVSDTYYVYDNAGNLGWVLTPEASSYIASSSTTQYTSSSDIAKKYCYVYTYDGQSRQVGQQIPGAEVEWTVYDNEGNVTMSQPGNLRSANQWIRAKYNNLGQETEASIVTTSMGRVTLQSSFDSNSTTAIYALSGTLNTDKEYTTTGQNSSLAFETVTDVVTSSNVDSRNTHLLTYEKNLVLGNSSTYYVEQANYYDYMGRVVQQVEKNHLGNIHRTSFLYDFSGNVLIQEEKYGTTAIRHNYLYDERGRVQNCLIKVNGISVDTVFYTYDDLGRMTIKRCSSYPQNYAYNIRNQLTSISGTKFSEDLYYNTGNGTACYNGNISSMTWSAGGEATLRGYKYSYDGLNRMTSAIYGEGSSIGTNANHYTETITGYTKNGAITGLQRYGLTTGGNYALIDNLTYILNGNQLKKVTDAATAIPANGGMHFIDGSGATTEYTYDSDGNLTQDLNKGISSITYNVLNLPNSITMTAGNISYLYSADGIKLRTVHGSNTTDYCGNFIYENGILSKVLTAEGYVKFDGTNSSFHYYLKDHQGNNRVVINYAGGVEQVNHYYPFGALFAESTDGTVQKYKYNGKELDTTNNLNLYDYGARSYDSVLGIWTIQDPLVEKYYSMSPYSFCGNNPVNRIDKDGREWSYVVDANGHTTINIALNFSVVGNHTAEQINAYKNAIATQFNSTISEVSGGAMSGTITFYEGNQNIVQTLALDKMDGAIGGTTSFFNSSVNLINKAGELRSLSDVGSDATHEMLHTVRLEHPFETTQTEDTKLLRVAPNSFVSTPTTDANIVNNVMNYPMITIDGQKSTNQNSLTKGQLNFMMNEINLQNQGYGFKPKYNPALTPEQNTNLYKQYYENYWLNTPGTPVGNK